MSADFELEVDDDPRALERLREPWSALCDRCRFTTPFQRPEWLLPWMASFGPKQSWIGTAWSGGQLVGLAPLFVYGHEHREVAMLGAGISDYLDVVCAPACEEAMGNAVLRLLARRRDHWDRCHFDDLRSESPLCLAAGPSSWHDLVEIDGAWSVLELAGTEFRWLPAKRRKAVRAALRRAERDGPLTLERADRSSWSALFSELERLHQARWRERGEDGVLADGQVRAFHRRVADAFAARERLGLYRLSLGDRTAAVLYGLEERDTFSYYLSGFDPAYAQLSPGTLIVALVAEDAARRGLRRFDFLRGREAYKRSFGAREQQRLRRVLQ